MVIRVLGQAEYPIVGVDLVAAALERAKSLGASHLAAPEGVPEVVERLTSGVGFDCALEAVGSSRAI